ncbi:co-chaperone GroES [Planctomycetota bacterium]
MKLKPLDDRIVLKPLEEEEKTAGGIVLPDTAKEKPQRGEVIAVGEGKLLDNGKRIKPLVKQGDRVIYGKFAGTEIKVEDIDYIIMKETELLARL